MIYKWVVQFDDVSDLPRHTAVNTFYFNQPGPPGWGEPHNPGNVLDMLDDFYTGKYDDQPQTVGMWLSANIKREVRVTAYRLPDPTPRSPVFEGTFTLPAAAGTTEYPAEVALVMSYEAQKESGVPQARRRGRIYLGPFNAEVAGDGRPGSVLINSIAYAGKGLKNAADASVEWEWVVWSPTSDSYALVHRGWIDNAWDTQRRRGIDASSRTVFDEDSPA